MIIEFLQKLESNPKISGTPPDLPGNTSYSISEIEDLEHLYHNGKKFPKALREWLFLAGEYCWVLGGNAKNLQITLRETLNHFGLEIDRPFFVVHYDGETFDLVFLDEAEEDPKYYHCLSDTDSVSPEEKSPEIKYSGESFSKKIEKLIDLIRSNYNP